MEVRGQLGSVGLTPAKCVLGIKVGPPNFGASVFIHRTILSAQKNYVFLQRPVEWSRKRGGEEEKEDHVRKKSQVPALASQIEVAILTFQ